MGDTSNIRIGNDINIKFKIGENAGFTADQVDDVICFIMKKDSDCCQCNCCNTVSEYSLCCNHPVYNTTPYNINTRCYRGFVDFQPYLKKYIDYQDYTQQCRGASVAFATPCMYKDDLFYTLYPADAQCECGDYYLIIQYRINNNGIRKVYTYEYDDVFRLTCKGGHQGYCEIDLTNYKPIGDKNMLKIYTLSEEVFNSNPSAEQLDNYYCQQNTVSSSISNITFTVGQDDMIILRSEFKILSITMSGLPVSYIEYNTDNDEYLYKLGFDFLKDHTHTITIQK